MRTFALTVAALLVLAWVGWDSWATARRLPAGVQALDIEAAADNPLRGTLRATTDEPATLRVRLTAGDHGFSVTPTTPPTTNHEIPLLELRPDRTYDVAIELLGTGDARRGSRTVGSLETGRLPPEAPELRFDRLVPGRMAPGLTLLELSYRPVGGAEGVDTGWLLAFDESGAVVWYAVEPFNIHAVTRLEDGDLLFTSDETGARRLRPTGEVVAEWRGRALGQDPDKVGRGLPDGAVRSLPIQSMHHEMTPLPDGSVLTLSRELREITVPEPTCDEEDEDAPSGPVVEGFVADTVVRFDPDTGEVLEEHSLWDVLDPLGDDAALGLMCIGVIDDQFPEDVEVRDWTHANGVIPIDDGATYLVSARHTSQLVAIRARDEPGGPAGSLRWKIGPETDAELRSGEWFYFPHAPELQPDGSILLYDNGNLRPEVDEPYSRAVRYEIDGEAGQVRQVWEEDFGKRIYAGFLSEADRLDDGRTVLVTHGGITDACAHDEDETTNSSRIIEVTEDTGARVLDLTVSEPDSCDGWTVYRSERLPTLYPPEFEVHELG